MWGDDGRCAAFCHDLLQFGVAGQNIQCVGIENGWIPQTAVFQNGGELTDSRGYPAWNTDALVDVMSMFRDWQSGQGYEGPFVGPGQSSETVWSNLASGNAVFSCEGPWWIEQRFDEYERNLGDREDSEGKTYKPLDIMNMSKLYALDEDADCASDIYGVGHCFSITRTCDTNAKRAAAAVYAEYMTSHSASYMQGGHLPASKEVLSSPQYLESEYYARYLQEFGDPENFRMLGNTPYYTEVYEGLKSVYIDIFSSNTFSNATGWCSFSLAPICSSSSFSRSIRWCMGSRCRLCATP